MKTAVSVPDDVFEQADRLAERLGKSRSQLYTEALADYLVRHDPETVTEKLDEVLGALDAGEDRFVDETARSVLERAFR